MRWCKQLFLGRQAQERADEIIREAADEHFVRDLFLITLAPNGIDQMNLIPANGLIGKKSAIRHLDLIAGLAIGREEALQVLAGIARQTYLTRGDGNLRAYILSLENGDGGFE